MKRIILTLVLLSCVFLSARSDFADFKKANEGERKEFNQSQAKAKANYYSQQDSLFIQYKEDIEKLWNEFKESTPKEWVSYNSDFTGRSSVDFANNDVKIEAVVNKDNTEQDAKAKKILKEQVVSVLKEKDDLTNQPILKNQVKDNNNEVIKEEEVEKKAEEIVSKAKKKTVKNKDGKELVRYKINLKLIPNNIKKRVERYKPEIERLCKKYEVDPSLALAIIHTESFFNPKAYNRHGNAYGMMQIVPEYAGLTMNNYIFHNNRKPSSRRLYNPKINLEMGIGYMRWLADNKWKKVSNNINQEYCIICSYNGGPGTIYKAMTGKMRNIGSKWEPMFVNLSKMKNDKLFRKLRRDVPFAETRKYLKLVTSKRIKYYAED